jgi:hypothetical protein
MKTFLKSLAAIKTRGGISKMNMSEDELNEILKRGQVKVTGGEFKPAACSPSPSKTINTALKKSLEGESIQTKQVKQNKYRNQKTEVRGIKFDSKKEAARYEELLLLRKAGEIHDLKLQETFIIQRAFTTPDGKRIRAITYTPDFTYRKWTANFLEDVKSSGTRTQQFEIKWKMMQEKYPEYECLLT